MSAVKKELMNPARKVLRCAIYIRVSTAMQKMEGWSLSAQRASLTSFAQARGWKVIGVYADEGKSARKRLKDRKEIFRLLDDVKNDEVDVILFKELDRWFRNVADYYKVQEVLDEYGVAWVSEKQPDLDITTKEGRLTVNVLLSVGQNEADSTSDRIKYTNKYMREQKRWNCGKVSLPRGYTLDDDQHVIIDPEWESYVRKAIEYVKRFGSVRKAMLAVNEEFEQKMLYSNFCTMLKNPLLCGNYKEVEGFVEKPYLTKEEFEALQELIVRNGRNNEWHYYIFSSLIRCNACGYKMTGDSVTNRHGKTFLYYRCRKGKVEGTCSNTQMLNEKKIEAQLFEYIREAVADRIATVKAVHQEKKARKPRKSNKVAIERQLDKLEDLYISSDRMTKERYEEKRAEILAKLIEDEEPMQDEPQLANLEQIQALFNSGVEKIYEGFTPEERREFWLKIVKEIRIDGDKVVGVDFIE